MGKQARSYRMRRYPDMASVTVVEPHYRGGYHVSTLLVIECDGESHDTEEQHLKDQRRDAYFKNLGVTVLRFSNHEILEKTNEVIEAIRRYLVESQGR